SLLLLLRAAAEAAGGSNAPAGENSAPQPLLNKATVAGPALYPVGGMGALTAAMAKAAEAAGAQVRTGARVTRILVSDGKVDGVVLENGEEIRARTVISNADPRSTLLGLISPEHFGPQLLARVENFHADGAVAKMN